MAKRGKEVVMNPLVNTDLQTYLKELVDHHLPGKDSEDKDPAGSVKSSLHWSDEPCPPTGEEKGQ
jgi:hypothetical protein